MAKYSKNQSGNTKPSPTTVEAANNIAKGSKKDGQSKQQTKLIALGIQKGIDHYKKQEKAKARELDKHNKKRLRENQQTSNENETALKVRYKQHWLPWVLLFSSWIAIAVYELVLKTNP